MIGNTNKRAFDVSQSRTWKRLSYVLSWLGRFRETIAFILILIFLALLAVSNSIWDIDHLLGVASGSEARRLVLVDLAALRSISLALTAGFISILVFLPAMISVVESQKENLQLTVIERQQIARLGDVSAILRLATLGAIYSVIILLAIGYVAVSAQAALLISLLGLVVFRLERILVAPSYSFNGFLSDAVDGLVQDMEMIVADRMEIEGRADEFDEHMQNVAERHQTLDIRQAFHFPAHNRVFISIAPDKRLMEQDLTRAVGYLEEELPAYCATSDELKDFKIIVFNPFRNSILEGEVPVMAIREQSRSQPADLSGVIDGVREQLMSGKKEEPLPNLNFWEAKQLIVKDFASCLANADLKAIERNFLLLNRISFPHKENHSSERQTLANTLGSDISNEIVLAGDRFMHRASARRLVLGECFRVLKSAVRNRNWQLFETYTKAVSALFGNEYLESISRAAIPHRVIENELGHFFLVLYEQVWILRRLDDLPKGIIPFYSHVFFEAFKVAIDWCVYAEEKAWRESSRPLIENSSNLFERFFLGSDANRFDKKAGALIVLSMQAYLVFEVKGLDRDRAKVLFKSAFCDLPPQEFGQLLCPLIEDGSIEGLRWENWLLMKTPFGGGYSFSQLSLIRKCAFINWVCGKGLFCISDANDGDLRSEIEYFRENETMYDELLNQPIGRKLNALEEKLEQRAKQER